MYHTCILYAYAYFTLMQFYVYRYILWDKVPELTSVRRNLQKLQSDLTAKQGLTGQIVKGVDKVRIMTTSFIYICAYIVHHYCMNIVVYSCVTVYVCYMYILFLHVYQFTNIYTASTPSHRSSTYGPTSAKDTTRHPVCNTDRSSAHTVPIPNAASKPALHTITLQLSVPRPTLDLLL